MFEVEFAQTEAKMTQKIAHSINDLVQTGIGCRSKIHQLIREGKLVARKNGARTVILDEDLRQYLAALPKVTETAA